MQSTLEEFQETQSQEAFALQNAKLLKVSLDQVTIQAKLGSMVAYQGDVSFEHAGSGGMGRMLKKAVSGEGTSLMKMTGTGEVFLADTAQDIHLIKLENDAITCNGANVLAFDAGIDWDIQRVEGGMAGAMAGGLYNMSLGGTGWIAVISHGPPVLLNTGQAPTFCDPQAAITWSSGVQTQGTGRMLLRRNQFSTPSPPIRPERHSPLLWKRRRPWICRMDRICRADLIRRHRRRITPPLACLRSAHATVRRCRVSLPA